MTITTKFVEKRQSWEYYLTFGKEDDCFIENIKSALKHLEEKPYELVGVCINNAKEEEIYA